MWVWWYILAMNNPKIRGKSTASFFSLFDHNHIIREDDRTIAIIAIYPSPTTSSSLITTKDSPTTRLEIATEFGLHQESQTFRSLQQLPINRLCNHIEEKVKIHDSNH